MDSGGVRQRGRFEDLSFDVDDTAIPETKPKRGRFLSLFRRTRLWLVVAFVILVVCSALVIWSLESPLSDDQLLWNSALLGNMKGLKKAILEGANIEYVYRGITPIYAGVLGGHAGVVEHLLGLNASMRFMGPESINPFHETCRMNREDLMMKFITADSRILASRGGVAHDWFCIHFAAARNADKTLRTALEMGDSIEMVRKSSHETPLHIACVNGASKVVTVLLQRGANVEARDAQSRTPLHLAVMSCHEDIVRVLVNEGKANCKAVDSQGHSALHYTSMAQCPGETRYLLERCS